MRPVRDWRILKCLRVLHWAGEWAHSAGPSRRLAMSCTDILIMTMYSMGCTQPFTLFAVLLFVSIYA